MSLIGYCAVLLERRPTIEWRRRSGRIPTSRELASDYAQANSQLYWMPASISSDEFRVARQPIQIIACAFDCGNSIRCNLSRRAFGTSMRMVGVTGNDRTAASRK